jgi:hypothetical protein
MAIVAMMGWDYCGATTCNGWSAPERVDIAGRFGGQAARVGGQNQVLSIAKALPSSYATLICGFAIQQSSGSAGQDLFDIRASTTNACRVTLDSNGRIAVKNSGGTTIATGTTVLRTGVWHYIEIKAFQNGASGTIEVHLTGVVEIASTVGNIGSANFDTVLMTTGNGIIVFYDDVYVADTTGTWANDFLGDVKIATIMPSSDGAHTQFTPSTGTAHWSLVDEISASPPNGDTDYVADGVAGDIDTYGYQDVDTAATIYAIQQTMYARKDDTLARQIANVIRQGGADTVKTARVLASTYDFYGEIYPSDPASAQWTPTNVNADEFGVKVVA